jgi:hypothetical protein
MRGVEKEQMHAQLLLASDGGRHGPRVTDHKSPVAPPKPFSFTLLSKNASANHLESHSCKNKGLKVPCFHTLTKKGVGEGFRISCFDFRVSSRYFRLLTVAYQLTTHQSLVTSHATEVS